MWQMKLPFGPARQPRRPVVEVEKAAPQRPRPLKLLMDLRPEWQRDPNRGPGPSRIVYRIRRAWAKAWVRQAVRLSVPVLAAGVLVWQVLLDRDLRAGAEARLAAWMEALSARPEFAVNGVAVTGASEDLELLVRERIALRPGASSLNIDVARVRADLDSIGAVRRADVLLDPQGVLRIAISERMAVALWRDGQDRLFLLGDDGVRIAPAVTRDGYPSLPLLLGDGAPEAVGEALDLFVAAPDLHPRLRAIVRVGERRWDLVLDQGLRILLPEDAPEDALAHAVALHYGEEIFDRDLVAVDMRIPHRPTLRMTSEAAERLRVLDAAGPGLGEDT